MLAREGASAAAELLLGLETLVVAGGVFAYRAYEEHELKKQQKAIASVEKLYDAYLARIPVQGYKDNKTVKLPPIFREATDNTPKASIILQIQAIEDLYDDIPLSTDLHLMKYVEHIRNAMRKLAYFHERRLHRAFHKGEVNDITSAVLSYLILMLSNHGLKFEGYSVDIAYLDAIMNFIDAFASNNKNKEQYEQMALVYAELAEAKAILESHSTSLSMEEMIVQFEADCGNASEKMIRIFAKLIMPHDNWRAVDFAVISDLRDGIVIPEYEYKNKNWHWSSSRLSLPDCVISQWLMTAAKDYLQSLRYPGAQKSQKMQIDSRKCRFLARGDRERQDELKKIKAEVFKKSANVLTLSVQDREFVAISDENYIAQRTRIYFDFYQLIDRMVVARCFCANILLEIKQLGEKYVKDSHECDYIFQVLRALGQQIKILSSQLSRAIDEIKLSSCGAMYPHVQNTLINELDALLDCAKEELSVTIEDIVRKHHARLARRVEAKLIHIGKKDKLLELTQQISRAYDIETPHQLLDAEEKIIAESTAEKSKDRRKKDPSINALYRSILEMRDYGNYLLKEDAPKGKIVVDLSDELEDCADNFIANANIEKDQNPPLEEFKQFREEFTALLHSKDEQMAVHRAKWKIIVANVAIALSVIGTLPLISQLAYSRVTTGRASFFFHQTKRERLRDEVEESLDHVNFAMGA